jgi:hypothetical protein
MGSKNSDRVYSCTDLRPAQDSDRFIEPARFLKVGFAGHCCFDAA